MSTRAQAPSAPPAAPGAALLPPAVHAGLWALVALVLGAGLFLPDLMYGDAAQDAVMALRMFREGDWVNLIKNGQDYLDKPHLLFWSAMAGYHAFGVHDWAYRLPSVLVSLLGAFSAGRLARRLYGPRAGQLAALLFITSQAILLGDHDVRMDALLTGFTAFALWQLVAWAETGELRPLLLGAAGLGLAVSSKGMVAVALTGLCLVLFLWGRRRLSRLLTPRLLLAAGAFLLALAPVLLCYYLQFDLHPEKVVRGRTGVSGVRFILLGQSADRFGGGHGAAAADDYLFFFHSLLWAFLPWTAPLLWAWWGRLRALWTGRLAAFRGAEQLSFLGPLLYVALLNLSRFKLPHYLNVAFPLLAVLVAGHLDGLARAGRERGLRVLTRVQDAVVVLLLLLALGLNAWAFPVRSAAVVASALVFAAALAAALRLRDPLQRLWVPSAVAALLVNFLLDASFYPQLCRYQPGSAFAREALRLPVDWDRLYFVGGDIYQPFQFYTGHLVPAVAPERLAQEVEGGRPAFALVSDQGLAALAAAGLRTEELASSPDCRITMLRWPLLDPATRETACRRARLVRVGGS